MPSLFQTILHGRLTGLLVLGAVIAVLPLFLPNNFYLDIAILAGFNAVVCVGLNLLIGYAGQISLGHAGFFGIGAYASGVLAGNYGWPPVLALLAGAVFVGLLAFAVAKPILRLKGHYLAMATLGIGIIVSIVLRTESGLTGGPDGMTVEPFRIFGFELYGEKTWYWVVGALLVAVVWLSLNLIDSPMGRALRAVHGSEVAAEVVGVDTARFKAAVFVLSAVFASVAGSLFAHYAGLITPAKADFFKSIELVTMVVFGGMASTFGAVVGAVVLTLLPQALTVFQDYQQIVLGAILMATMVFMPKGLLPTLAALLPARRRA
ncbi:branched-chain amino acid ABC transporter permease [Azospirillum doebereinerae]|uniref:Branched-chain amino acid ABC transporter permease n=1 Tax=Azospirillum doebereinerae TaxID=92933 RepID=A0A433JCB2_9PROT|nr:branched-chain amino acid ABC transporter permease [Azospirillum doebereinerae]RUQ74242.1 branched-chain amino acid ABC transporter permease [Azospirillum doebereinerae]